MVYSHMEITAFLVSLCKVLWTFKTGLIAPNVNLTTRNPAIKWNDYRLRVPVEAERLPCRSESGRSLIAMTSSGITGTNGHCVVEGPPVLPGKSNTFWLPGRAVPALVVTAGLSPLSANAVADRLKELLARYPSHQLAHVYGRRARSLTWRAFGVVADGVASRFPEPVLAPKSTPPLVFVFSGQGPQHFQSEYIKP